MPAALDSTGKYQNNRVECDHGRLKARLRPMRGLKTHRTAESSFGATRSSRTYAATSTSSPSTPNRCSGWPPHSANSDTRSDIPLRPDLSTQGGPRSNNATEPPETARPRGAFPTGNQRRSDNPKAQPDHPGRVAMRARGHTGVSHVALTTSVEQMSPGVVGDPEAIALGVGDLLGPRVPRKPPSLSYAIAHGAAEIVQGRGLRARRTSVDKHGD